MNEEIVQQVNRDWQELVRSCGSEYVLTQEEGFADAWLAAQVNRDWQELVRGCGSEYVLTQEEGFVNGWLAAEASRLGIGLEQLHEILEAI